MTETNTTGSGRRGRLINAGKARQEAAASQEKKTDDQTDDQAGNQNQDEAVETAPRWNYKPEAVARDAVEVGDIVNIRLATHALKGAQDSDFIAKGKVVAIEGHFAVRLELVETTEAQRDNFVSTKQKGVQHYSAMSPDYTGAVWY